MNNLNILLDENIDEVIDQIEEFNSPKLNRNILTFVPLSLANKGSSTLSIFTPEDFLTPGDEYNLFDLVYNLSHHWYKYYSENDSEPKLNETSISELFTYEIEQSLSGLLYVILVINRAIKKFKPSTLTIFNRFCEGKDFISLINQFNGLSEYLFLHDLKGIFSKLNDSWGIKIDFVNTEKYYSKNTKSKSIFLRLKLMHSRFTLNKVKKLITKNFYKLYNTRNPRVIVNGNGKCLGEFISIAQKKFNIEYYPENDLEDLNIDADKVTHVEKINANVYLEDLLINYVIIRIIEFCLNKFQLLLQYYNNIIHSYSNVKIKLFVTIYASWAVNRVTILAFQNIKVRTCWHADGLGQPLGKIWKYYESASWYNNPSELWLLSKMIKEEYKKNKYKKDIRITGYLDGYLCKSSKDPAGLKRKLKIKPGDTVITYATSVTGIMNKRLVVEEGILEIFNGIKDFIYTIRKLPNYNLIIKLHPGFIKYKKLILKIIGEGSCVQVITNESMGDIINISDIVAVYHSSVGLETLLCNKKLIIYNHTNRPSFLTELHNHNLQYKNFQNNCSLIHTKEEIIPTIQKLLSVRTNVREDGLDYILENANRDYDVSSVVDKLLESYHE